MKSRNFTLTLLMLLSLLSLHAQEADEIMPFLQEGKTWNCYDWRFQRDEEYFIKGDTACFGMECKKMYYEVEGNTILYCVLYETDGKNRKERTRES